ncbi:MAG: HAMP domain-containing protein [Acidobacteria bacterium]|nr:HAMP domain-containing protein [Acidobacteriota bacterium]
MSTAPPSEYQRRARHRRLVIAGLAFLVVSFVAIEIALQQSIDAGVPAVLLHSITVLNIVLLLTLLFVLGRNLIKLYVDRRHRKLGSKFQTKLMATYVGLALVPSILLFLVASDFIQKSVDRWFSSDVTAMYERARELSRLAILAEEDEVLDIGVMLAEQVTDGVYVGNEAWQVLERDLGYRLAESHYDLDIATFYRNGESQINAVVREGSFLQGREHHLAVDADLLQLAQSGQQFRRTIDVEGRNRLLIIGSPVFAIGTQEVEGVLIVGRMVDAALAAEAAAIEQLYGNYEQGVQGKEPITNAYLLVFLLISLLIIFGAVWLGLYLARGVTVPIRKLSEGTRAVAAGNLDYRVDAVTNDELGVLVESFNRMTSDLGVGQRSLEQSRIDLEQTIAELEERRSYMESVLANIATGVVSVNAHGHITTINPAASEMLGIEQADAVGAPYDTVFAGENMAPLRTLMQHARPRLAALEEELSLDANGRRLTLAAHCSSLRDKSGDYLGTVTVLDDLTGLIGAQKAAAWREVARRVAHEIRNPLTPIQLSAQRIARRYQRAAGAEAEYAVIEEGTRTILQEVATLKSLVEEFTRFARMPSAQPVAMDLHQLLDDSLRPYPDTHPGIEITRHYGRDLPRLELDPDQMRRAFTNLFDNAMKAMDGTGKLAVSTVFDDDLEVVRIAVTDNGPGIRAEDKEQLFVPYFSRDRDGTGLGLAIVRQIVSDHRGYIRVVDNVPRGATFVIELPTG